METQNDHELFCHKCFEEKFGSITIAPNIYSETAKIIAVDDKGCPRCGGAVYHAEEIFEGGRSYHKKCFSCKTCKKNISSKRQGESYLRFRELYFNRHKCGDSCGTTWFGRLKSIDFLYLIDDQNIF